jgi:serine carboxypeptidase-like clade I
MNVALSFTAIFATATLLGVTSAARMADRVQSLPGYGPPPSPMYSGFLNASAADPVAGVQLHYWYTETTNPNLEATKAPVVLWLNGGPGSSSVLGLMEEWGPLIVNATGGLSPNPYAWTNLANVVLLESPSGVGYSYCASSTTTGCANTDVSTARAARVAMQEFFKAFPELSDNEFFITGESYAGVYVPTLVKEILDNAPEINIQGMAVGDPCTDNTAQKDSMDMIWYGHKNGFVAEATFDLLWNTCGARHPVKLMTGETHSRSLMKSMTMKATSTECVVAQRKYLTSTSKGFSQVWLNDYINNLDLFSPSAVVSFNQPGSLNYKLAAWMMRDDVKHALHVEDSPNKQWPGPGPKWQYKKQWDACNANPEFNESMVGFYKNIAPRLEARGGRTIVFNGDTDPCVSYEGTRAALATVYPELPGGAYRPWFYNQSAATYDFLASKPLLFGPNLALVDAGAQLGGMVVNYEHNLHFVTVHGSGHMVPQFRPQSALKLLSNLLSGDSFAEFIPTDEQLAAFTDDDFNAWIDKWTTLAKEEAAKPA